MARLAQNKSYKNFENGIVRDVTPLDSLESAAIDLLNVDRKLDGSVERRPGLVLDGNRFTPEDHPYNIPKFPDNIAEYFDDFNSLINSEVEISRFLWRPTSQQGRKHLVVLQVGRFLYFWEILGNVLYDEYVGQIDLTTYRADTAVDIDVDYAKAGFSAGYGKLYVVSEAINPLQVEYNFDTSSLQVNVISPQVRDFDTITEDDIAVDEYPSSISSAFRYDLYNRGWTDSRIDDYRSEYTRWPARNDIPSLAENAVFTDETVRRWDARIFEGINFGTAEAAQGTFLFDPRKVKRSDKVSGLSTSYDFFSNTSYSCVAFFAGRVWLSGLNDDRNTGRLFFSQIAQTRSNLNKMHQSQDPTAKDFNELLDNDGGEIPILESGRILKMVPMINAIVIFADNGIWQVDGGGGGFTANSYQIRQITTTPIIGLDSVIRTEKGITFWANEAIYIMEEDELGQLKLASLTEQRISDFYNNEISFSEKANSTAMYDAFNRRVIWLYGEARGMLNKALILYVDNGAFFRHEYYSSSDVPSLIGIFAKPYDSAVNSTTTITTSTGEDITTSTGELVQQEFTQIFQDTTATKFFVLRDDGTGKPIIDMAQFEELTSGSINDRISLEYLFARKFADWGDNEYDSYVEPRDENFGEFQRHKQAMYVSVFFERTEDRYVQIKDFPDGEGGTEWRVIFSEPSDVDVVGIYGYSNKYGTGKRTGSQKGYKLSRPVYPTDAPFTYSQILTDGGGSLERGMILNSVEYEYPQDVLDRKLKLRGRGKAFRVRIGTSKAGHNFVMLGWAGQYSVSENT